MQRWRRGSLSTLELSLLACVALFGLCVHKFYNVETDSDSASASSSAATQSAVAWTGRQQDIRVMATESITYQKVGIDPLVYAAIETDTEEPISVKKWAKWMSQSKRASILAQDLTRLIRSSGYKGIFLETPGVSSQNASQKQFRICIINGPSVAKFASSHASSSAFKGHLDKCTDPHVCSFPNLGGDALLVVPQKHPGIKDVTYSHLAEFLRGAPEEQITQVWKKVASTYLYLLQTREGTKPVWLSTEGTGVPWLHFRFDDRPKYYHYSPFAQET